MNLLFANLTSLITDQAKIVEYSLDRQYDLELFKGFLPQISLGPFLNALSHLRKGNSLNLFSGFRRRCRVIFGSRHSKVGQVNFAEESQ